MSVNPVARVYAEALFAIAEERSLVDDMGQALEGFRELIQEEREIELFLSSPVIDPTEKIERLRSALAGRMDDTVADFLCLLVEKRRFGALSSVVEAFRAMADDHAGRTRVTVRTPTALPDALRSEFGAALKQALRREIVIETDLDPSIMGGAVVSIGDKVYDGSIRGRLKAFRQQIMRSRGYEDQG